MFVGIQITRQELVCATINVTTEWLTRANAGDVSIE